MYIFNVSTEDGTKTYYTDRDVFEALKRSEKENDDLREHLHRADQEIISLCNQLDRCVEEVNELKQLLTNSRIREDYCSERLQNYKRNKIFEIIDGLIQYGN